MFLASILRLALALQLEPTPQLHFALRRDLAPGLGLHHRRFRDDLALQHHALGDGFALGQDGSF